MGWQTGIGPPGGGAEWTRAGSSPPPGVGSFIFYLSVNFPPVLAVLCKWTARTARKVLAKETPGLRSVAQEPAVLENKSPEQHVHIAQHSCAHVGAHPLSLRSQRTRRKRLHRTGQQSATANPTVQGHRAAFSEPRGSVFCRVVDMHRLGCRVVGMEQKPSSVNTVMWVI